MSLYEISGSWIEIGQIDFNGQFSRSTDGRFILAWDDSAPNGGTGGFRDSGRGRYILLEGESIIIQGTMHRPNDGKVSDTGNFILNDYGFGEGCKGTCFAFSRDGRPLAEKHVRANLGANGISDSGDFAVFSTYDTPDSDEGSSDGGRLFLFDLRNTALMAKFDPYPGESFRGTGWPTDYHFDCGQRILFVTFQNAGPFRYSFDGTCLDADQMEAFGIAAVNKAMTAAAAAAASTGYALMDKAGAILDTLTGSELATYTEVIDLYTRSLQKGVSEYNQARVQRILGEIFLRCGEKPRALEHLENALRLNPKIGVKNLVTRLKTSST